MVNNCLTIRWWWLLLYSAVLRSRADSLRSHVILHEWLAFYSVFFFNIHWSGVLKALAWLGPHETAAVSAQVLRTPYNHALRHFMQSHILKTATQSIPSWHSHCQIHPPNMDPNNCCWSSHFDFDTIQSDLSACGNKQTGSWCLVLLEWATLKKEQAKGTQAFRSTIEACPR